MSGRVPHDKLSLTVKESVKDNHFIESDIDSKFKPNRISVKTSPANTTINIQRTLPLLESNSKQDIFSRKHKVIESSKIATWEEITLMPCLDHYLILIYRKFLIISKLVHICLTIYFRTNIQRRKHLDI
ncbi:hypothetical protein DMUE_5115 [Dictyocoela muelleri]|nr:hypothetical protein DMUE_5115 [Dictyocoela muelleri]